MRAYRFTRLILMVVCLGLASGLLAAGLTAKAPSAADAPGYECQLFPLSNAWNTPIDTMPVDANSDAYINSIGAGTTFHPDFGSGSWNGSPIGMFYMSVPTTQPRVAMTFGYANQSDPGPYPFPTDVPIEGGGDRHVFVIDRDDCVLYETWNSHPTPDGSWYAGSGAIYDLNSNALRPDTWTSADAAGLPVLSGLMNYDEVAAGEVRHAIRFTADLTRSAHVWPARHDASDLTDPWYPPMGQRFRLKANFDISGFSPQMQVILRGFKKYGIILADNGSDWYVSGLHDARWDDEMLVDEFNRLQGSDFEAVDASALMVDPNTGQTNWPWRKVYTPMIVR